MKFTLCRGNSLGDASDCYYPYRHVATDEETLIEAVFRDYVGALYFENWRCGENFIYSNVVIMDIDNTHSDNPD